MNETGDITLGCCPLCDCQHIVWNGEFWVCDACGRPESTLPDDAPVVRTAWERARDGLRDYCDACDVVPNSGQEWEEMLHSYAYQVALMVPSLDEYPLANVAEVAARLQKEYDRLCYGCPDCYRATCDGTSCPAWVGVA